MDNKSTQPDKQKQIEQAAEQWVNLVLEQIKHRRYAKVKLDDINKYNTNKNEKLYSYT